MFFMKLKTTFNDIEISIS